MFEIGNSLRQARENRGLDLSDVEREIRIRAKYLSALEEERFDVLPGEAYVRGFLRSYAEFLGLDGNLLVHEYADRFPHEEDELPIQPAGLARPGRRLARPAVGAGAAALAFSVVLVWQLGFTSSDRATVVQASAAAPRAHAAAPRTKAAKPAAAPARKQIAAPGVLVVRTTRGACWVAVRVGSPTGRLVFEKIVGQGSVLRFGLHRPLWVRLGAPWNTDVTLRGKPLPPFGRQVVNLTAR